MRNPEWLPSVEQMIHNASDDDVDYVIQDCRTMVRETLDNGPFDQEGYQYLKDLGFVLMSALKERDSRKITGGVYGNQS